MKKQKRKTNRAVAATTKAPKVNTFVLPAAPISAQKLKELTAQYYALLAAEGFEDIEEFDSPREMLKVWHSHKYLKTDPDYMAHRLNKYLNYSHHAHHTAGLTDRERFYLHKLSEGLSRAAIGKLIGMSASYVKIRINELLNKLGISDKIA